VCRNQYEVYAIAVIRLSDVRWSKLLIIHATKIIMMLESFIFRVLCSAGSDYFWQYYPIQCDTVVLLQGESIIRTTAVLNPCHLPDNVLRLTNQPMQQIVLTSCSVEVENDDETSFLLPLTPTPHDFWLEDGPDLIQCNVRLDFSDAQRMLEETQVIGLLKQPLPDFVENEENEKGGMEQNEVEGELLHDTNDTDFECVSSFEQAPLVLMTMRSHQPIIDPSLATPTSFFPAEDDVKNKVPQQSSIKHELSPLELYLQQEVVKNDRLICFLVVATIILLSIFGFVGYRILRPTNQRKSKAEEHKEEWLAKQHVRRQNRLHVERPFILKPIGTTTTTTTADRKNKLAASKVASNRPVSVSPPRPPKSPPRLVVPTSPPSSVSCNRKASSFEDELKAKIDKSCLTVNKPTTTTVSWEDLM
jgi:hypothetical protein